MLLFIFSFILWILVLTNLCQRITYSYAKGTSQEEREAAPERSLDLLRRMITSLEQYPTQRHTPDMCE